jgi:tripartite-type tricarboxylate transporter receptor subunit TctC
MFAPAKTPPATLARIEAEVRRAIATPEVRERLINISLTPIGNSSAEFRQFFSNAVKRYGDTARAAGIEPE